MALVAALVGPRPATAQEPTVPPPAQPPAPPAEPTEDDKRVGESLIRKAASDSDEDLMDGILRLMDEVSRKLDIDLDAGDDTQSVQRRIANQLDEAVREAAARRRPMRSQGQSTSPDKRRMPTEAGKRPKPTDKGRAKTGEADAAAEAGNQGGEIDPRSPGGELKETRRAWGHLPSREREEILQGVGEKFLEQYRTWIERYYRALQEPEE